MGGGAVVVVVVVAGGLYPAGADGTAGGVWLVVVVVVELDGLVGSPASSCCGKYCISSFETTAPRIKRIISIL